MCSNKLFPKNEKNPNHSFLIKDPILPLVCSPSCWQWQLWSAGRGKSKWWTEGREFRPPGRATRGSCHWRDSRSTGSDEWADKNDLYNLHYKSKIHYIPNQVSVNCTSIQYKKNCMYMYFYSKKITLKAKIGRFDKSK